MRRSRAISAGLIPLLGLLMGCSSRAAPSPPGPTPVVSFTLLTHCGIDELQLDGRWYERVGGRLDDGSGNPPPGWDNPQQTGRLERSGDDVVFTDSQGHRVTFQPRPGATAPKQMCS